MILKRCYLVTQGIILYSIPRRSGSREIEPGTYVCMLLLGLLGDKSHLFTKPECTLWVNFREIKQKRQFF
jgi:hypothetical protein